MRAETEHDFPITDEMVRRDVIIEAIETAEAVIAESFVRHVPVGVRRDALRALRAALAALTDGQEP